MKTPLISTIIPIYNVEVYLRETIDSILAQSIGFADNIQLVLVNDGSTDNSESICREFAEKYPQNVVYIQQKNSGVSKARNVGFEKATGKFVHFFDGDDMMSEDYYATAIEFLEKHSDIDFVAAKIGFFDEIIDNHPLNDKFQKDAVIDLSKNPDNPILHVITCIFRRKDIENIQFDERLQIAEDVRFISDVLLNKKRYGVVRRPTYYYRKRSAGGSAIGGKERNMSYYLDTPLYAYKYMLDSWQNSGDSRPIEYTLLYDGAYLLDQKSITILDEKEKDEYKALLKELFSRCSDEVIIRHRFLSIHQKMYLLGNKYGKKLVDHITYNGSKALFDGFELYDYGQSRVFFDFLTRKDGDRYGVEGYFTTLKLPRVSFTMEISGKQHPLTWKSRERRERSFLGDMYDDGGAFETELDLSAGSALAVGIDVDGEKLPIPIDTGRFTRFGALKFTYRRDGDSLLKRSKYSIDSMKYSKSRHLYLEMRLWFQLLVNWRFRSARDQYRKLRSRNLKQLSLKTKVIEILKPLFIIGEAVLMLPRAFALRTTYYVAKRFKKRPIWIVSDRGIAAGDNGEALFRYIMQQDDRPADVYFAIAKKSKDFDRMKSIGPILIQNNLRYKLKFLLADKIISSQADTEVTNPFLRQLDHYVDLFDSDFIFLQHGIIRHNLSDWLNRYEKNIRLFITSAQKEYDSIFTNPYYYPEENILLSGMPRYDYLENKPNKKLILAPTYRKNLAKQKTDKIGVRRYDPTFKSSEYREFYNNLMNDKRLLAAMNVAGMKGEFYLHPVFSSQREDFDENDTFRLMNFPYDYKAAFREGELLISDHSSVMFDFAYLKKPVAYAHFDVDTFFDNHSYSKSDFFSDEDDGFGGVYYDYDSLIDGVVEVIESGRKMPQKYISRVDRFFYKVDKRNCERVYEAIKSTD